MLRANVRRRYLYPLLLAALGAATFSAAAGCGKATPQDAPTTTPSTASASTSSSADGGAATPIVPFAPNSPYTYVAKVKNILVGLPPTDAEVQSVIGASDPQAQLRSLIGGWMTLTDPAASTTATYYEEKMRVFFELATQQTQVGVTAFANQSYPAQIDLNDSTEKGLTQNAIESFARTMIAEVVDGTQPLTQVATTTTFMMTTALMELYAFLDTWQVDDNGSVVDAFAKANPGLLLTVGSASVPIAQSVTAGADFMHWTDPDLVDGGPYDSIATLPAGCATDPVTYPATGSSLHYLLYGTIATHSVNGVKCNLYGGTKSAPQVGNANNGGANDFDDWRMVTVRQPMTGEATTTFYDLPTLRQSNTLVLKVPRVGFFTTPAFFANWQTNTSNTMRVTMNQSLIVALGAMIDGTDSTIPPNGTNGLPPGLDATHASPGTACYYCHRLLDPSRSILSATYSWYYHTQDTQALIDQPGEFAFQGVIAYPQSVFDLATILSSHPLFASAWVQKLCEYANSQPCEANDPEFLRIVKDFQNSSYSWNALVADVLSSPLTTGATVTQTTADEGQTVAVARRDHLCAAINFRFGFDDICALLPTTTAISPTIAQIAQGLPSDGYGRGAVAPVLPNMPTLFYRAGTENICEALAGLLIDVPAAKQVARVAWSSANASAAIADFVQTVMGIVPSDPRYMQAVSILTSHDQAALSVQGTTPTEALESTFVAACIAPSAISIGM